MKLIYRFAFIATLWVEMANGAEPCALEFVKPLPSSLISGETYCGIPLSVEVGGTEPVFYQWQERISGSSEYQPLPNETNNTYTTPPFQPAMDSMIYRVVVTNACGAMVESSVTLYQSGDFHNLYLLWAGAYTTNRIFLKFSDPVIPTTTENFSFTPPRNISSVITNEFDLSVMELLLDDATPLEEGVDYELRIGGVTSLPPPVFRLNPDPRFVQIRLDAWEPPMLGGPLRLAPRLRATYCPTAQGCIEVYYRPDYLIWDSDDVLQYADSVEGPWITLPDAKRGHPIRQYFYDCQEHELPRQRFFRLVSREPGN